MAKLKDYPVKISEFVAKNAGAILIVITALMIIFMAMGANAGNQDHTCQGGNNCNSDGGGSNEQSQGQGQGQQQGQGQEQGQHQSSRNNNSSDSSSAAIAGASANAGALSNSGGNSLSAGGGESSSSSTASGGSAEATGGISNSVATSGDSSATGGNAVGGKSEASSGGNTQDIYVGGDTHEVAASASASVFAGYCQTGGSAQIIKGGFSVIQTEQFCNHLRLANVMFQAYERELSHCSCVGICTQAEASVRMECAESGQAEKFLDAYYENIWDANELIQSTQTTGWIDRVSKQLATPIGLIGALIWLL